MKALLLTMCIFVMFFVYGCGGGGGTGGNIPTAMGTPVSLATFKGYFIGYTSAGHAPLRFDLTGSDTQGVAWSGRYTLTAEGLTAFENQVVTKSSVQMTSNTPVSTISNIKYFIASNRNLYKITDSLGTLSYVPTNYAMPSSPANVGDYGNLATLAGSDGSTLTIAWELSPEFNGNSLLKISSVTRDIFNLTITTNEVDTFYLDRAGTPYKLALNVTTGGVTVTMVGAALPPSAP
jgi:hypothetical protein